MDIVFDIDGTLADPAHRLHFINDMVHWTCKGGKPPTPDRESFLANEQLIKDDPIISMWAVLEALVKQCNRVIFITGRAERARLVTESWLNPPCCFARTEASITLLRRQNLTRLPIYMRADGDRRPSYIVKEEGLMRARADGYNPVLVFEDRADDTAMWRRNGLLCCQVADGRY